MFDESNVKPLPINRSRFTRKQREKYITEDSLLEYRKFSIHTIILTACFMPCKREEAFQVRNNSGK
jgi:hypothetical protein